MMGYGDELMASGHAKGARARGKRIAFGINGQIRWHRYAEEIFWSNPNVAPPGSEQAVDLEWMPNYHGYRPYNRLDPQKRRWIWVPNTIKTAGEVFFKDEELRFADRHSRDFVVIEPNVAAFKSMAVNKKWPLPRYQQVVNELRAAGHDVVQLCYGTPHGPGDLLVGARRIASPSFRHSLAVMARARLYLGCEGGMHHGAAAVGIPAVVIFGGFISPDITGYPYHSNHFMGERACGSLHPCQHCQDALRQITVSAVLDSCIEQLKGEH